MIELNTEPQKDRCQRSSCEYFYARLNYDFYFYFWLD